MPAHIDCIDPPATPRCGYVIWQKRSQPLDVGDFSLAYGAFRCHVLIIGPPHPHLHEAFPSNRNAHAVAKDEVNSSSSTRP